MDSNQQIIGILDKLGNLDFIAAAELLKQSDLSPELILSFNSLIEKMRQQTSQSPNQNPNELAQINKFKLALNQSSIGIILIDFELNIELINRPGLEIFGYKEDSELREKSISELFTEAVFQRQIMPALKSVKKGEKFISIVEAKDHKNQAIKIWLLIIPNNNQQNELIGYTINIRNVSHEIIEQEELRRLNELMIGRELKMVELKEENDKLRKEINK